MVRYRYSNVALPIVSKSPLKIIARGISGTKLSLAVSRPAVGTFGK